MLKELAIREVALALLTHIYNNIDSNLHAKVECKSLVNESVSVTDLAIALKYLILKKFVDAQALANNTFECSITANGIDWVEDCNGSALGNHFNVKAED